MKTIADADLAAFTANPSALSDGEVLGLDINGTLLQWNGDDKEVYNSGESLTEFGIHNLGEHEALRLGIPASALAAAIAFYDARRFPAELSDLGLTIDAAPSP